MSNKGVHEETNLERRRFLESAAVAFAAIPLCSTGLPQPVEGGPSIVKATTVKTFDSIKQIDAGPLNVGYVEGGPIDGPPIMLLHGWPYDIYSFVDVSPILASKGYRVIIPYLRGYGTTRFLSKETRRNGQPSALALDVVAFMDALKIERATIAGFDWGARTANIIAALARAM